MKKRLLPVFLCLCMVATLFPAEALAAENDEVITCPAIGGNIYFDEATGAITDCDESVTAAEIPSAINGVAVTSIGHSAFRNCSSLTSVTIPNSVTSIGEDAFYRCSALVSVTIPGSVTSIGDAAFLCCGLTSVNISEGITSIGADAFNGCPLTGVDIPSSVTSIGVGAFGGRNVVNACLTAINVDEHNAAYCSVDGVLLSKDMTEIILYPQGCASSSYTAPNSVTTIGARAFEYCYNLTSLNLSGVTNIGTNAFCHCEYLISVTISNDLTSIDWGGFRLCVRLTDVYYSGSESDWDSITTGQQNDYFISAAIHYSSSGPGMGGAVEEPKPDYPDIPNIPDTDMSIKKTDLFFISYLGNRITSIPVNWGWNLFRQPAVKSNAWDIFNDNSLAVTGLALSSAVEASEISASNLLTSCLGFEIVESKNYDSSAGQHPAVTFACKRLIVDGREQYVFAVAVRGTEPGSSDDIWTDLSSLWGGFETAAANLYGQLGAFMGRTGLPDSDIPVGGGGRVKFFVTGHSLGGAVANIMAKKLSDVYGADNVFAYTFASPTTIRTAQAAGNIFNILNGEDGVTRLPGVSDHRYGWEVKFHRDANAHNGFYDRFKELVGREFDNDSAHAAEVYMSYLLSTRASKNTKVTLICVWCPVDVEIYDSDNRLAGSIKSNAAGDTVDGKTYIRVVDDKKYIYLLDDDEYTVKLTGTDNGTMTYAVQNIDVEMGAAAVEQVFENVALISGKQFVSEVKGEGGIAADVETQEVKLYVLDSDGTPEKEVLPDSSGTEVPITTPDVSDNPGAASNGNWTNPFNDVAADAWYYEAVKFVSANSLMNGIDNNLFAPDANLSRAQLAQILYNKEGKPAVSGGSAFTDAAASAWYSDAVIWAAANHIVGGYGNGLFGPNDNITREQLAVMLWRYAGEPMASREISFSDADQVSGFAQAAIRWAVENGILNGKGANILDPRGVATRAEVAQMFKNYLDN